MSVCAWFEIDSEGYKQLNTLDEAWKIAREFVANSFDEQVNGATKCVVRMDDHSGGELWFLVYDDGPGFRDIRDAFTLFGSTDKRADPLSRGRFNEGEKAAISKCIRASVSSPPFLITFRSDGVREIEDSVKGVDPGVSIEVQTCFPASDYNRTQEMLRLFIPPSNFEYIVNDVRVVRPSVVDSVTAVLETVILDTRELRPTERKTKVDIYRAPGDSGWLYELGIPVVKLDDCQFSVDVNQKIPLTIDRSNVKPSYLKSIYGVLLNSVADFLDDDSVSSQWVHQGTESSKSSVSTARKVMEKRFGNKVVLWSTSSRSNEAAREAGYEVIHGRALSSVERRKMERAGLQHASRVFPVNLKSVSRIDEREWTVGMHAVRNYTCVLADMLLGKVVSVDFVDDSMLSSAATFFQDQGSGGNALVTFNLAKLPNSFFEFPLGSEVTSIIVHELAHVKGFGHDRNYYSYQEQLFGKLVHLALCSTEKVDFLRRYLEPRGESFSSSK